YKPQNPVELAIIIAMIIALFAFSSPFTGPAIILALLAFQRQIGKLRTSTLLVTLGTVGLLEHPGFSIIFALGLGGVVPEAYELVLTQHASQHFFMAAIYTLIALALILFIAWDGFLHGRRSAWFAILGVLLVGGGAELLAGAFIFQMGAPFYALFGIPVKGFGWASLYLYLIAWPCALAVSFRSIFGKSKDEPV
ncbi:MAG: hypothetical protein PVJ21_14730, partial [Anaerolineales bacterium]